MDSPPSRLFKIWALASTALCVALVGYIAASHLTAPAGPASAPDREDHGDDPEASARAPLPSTLRELPAEWMSAAIGTSHTGHVALLDLANSRELILERCQHLGYFDSIAGEPRADGWPFCELVVRGPIESANESQIEVRGRDGRVRVVKTGVDRTGRVPVLVLEIDGERIDLAPGSKNDLYQRMETEPAIAAEREALLRFMSAGRREASEAAGAPES